jgi:TusE/DsrC/DsvC family sulfur relay protein
MSTTDLTPILQRLDAIAADVAHVSARQRRQEELFADMAPVARAALAEAIGGLDTLERKGYFAFAQALAGVGQRIVEGFSADDIRQLGDAVVAILDTVRRLTQPAALKVAAAASAALEGAGALEPMGIVGMVRATRDEDVQRGMALMVEVLRRIGHGVDAIATRQLAAEDRQQKLAKLLGPRRSQKRLGIERPQLPPGAPACAVTPKPAAVGAVLDGIAYTADGHLVDAGAWSRSLAEALAAAQSIAMSAAHWAVVDAARADFATTKVSPNIRRLTQIANVTTKDLYALFPKAPARTIAKIAGLPKPAGCL